MPIINKIDDNLGLVTFKKFVKGVEPVYSGDFLCWISGHHIQALNLATNSLSSIDLLDLVDTETNLSPDVVLLDSCDPRSLIRAGLFNS